MRELFHDDFYEILKVYDRLEVDYCLMANDSDSQGYAAHKEAVLFAMQRIQEKYSMFSVDEDKATGEEISADSLFSLNENFSDSGKISYWHAFAKPPHGTGPVIRDGKVIRNQYGREDFETVNHILFPQGTDELEIYDWSTDWSDYFDAGKEWWGTICCSIYDKRMNRYAVLMASSTD